MVPDAASQISGLVFALILVDPEGRIAQLNHATEALLGTSAKRLVGETFSSVVTALDTRVAHLLSVGEAALIARDVHVRFSGSEMPVNMTMSALPAYPGWRVVTISQLGHEQAASDEQASPAVGAPSILAHEIKNPLAAIRGAAQLIARKLPYADKSLARMITDEVDRIARLIDRMQLLGSQTAQSGEPCNAHEAIRSAVATVRAAGMRDVEIIEEFDPSIPLALAQRDALEQVLINLISNARDACARAPSSAGQNGKVTIRTRYVSGLVVNVLRVGRKVRLPIEISVSDNGPGVDPDLRERLFEPFVSSKSHGQGLGLALVRKLMRDMEGSVSHERESAKGLTHFRLHLAVDPSSASRGGNS
ncbi:MAG: PAS domain S-box protein [Erythrobacter sp.]|nr:PAS domain S-box protein [Erythrobacter sp.]